MRKNISFYELIEKYTIVIPQIHRDYAQGRIDKKTTEIRDNFLDETFEILTSNNQEQLTLDFVYGSTTEDKVFVPLDGQQRLTTLFLLHWYLCPVDRISVLQNRNEKIVSRFSYETRISSKDFCNVLVQKSILEIKESLKRMTLCPDNKKEFKISDAIMNEPWFSWSWRKDPTIKGMLVMLDAIDERIKSCDADLLWRRITTDKKIVFNMLPLEKFNLTSDLYVKMNARGKELSSFDILKSTLEEQMQRNNVDESLQQEWARSFDNKWTDLFWSQLAIPYFKDNKDTTDIVKKVEKCYLQFLKRMMFFHLYLIEDFKVADRIDKTIYPEGIKSIREYVSRNDILSIMPQLGKCRFFDESLFSFINDTMQAIMYESVNMESICTLIDIDHWNSEASSNTLLDIFVSEKITYSGRALFFAVIQFSKYYSATDINHNHSYQVELNEWMRIIRNLIQNTALDSSEILRNVLKEIQQLAFNIYSVDDYQKSVLTYFSENGVVARFNGEQIEEEQEKARKILKSEVDKESIFELENFAFFKGCVRFLFTDRDGKYDWTKFSTRANKAKEYFDSNGVKSTYRANSVLMCSLISQFTKWEQCYGGNKIRIGNGVEVWSYIIRNRNLQQALVDLLDLDSISANASGFSSQIDDFDEGYEKQEKLAHEDMCNNELITEAVDVMGEGIILNWRYNQFALYRPSANADWKKYVIGNRRNAVLFDLRSRGIISTTLNSEQNISGKPYFWGWNIEFKYKDKRFCWKTNDKLAQYDLTSESYIEIKDVEITDVEGYLNSINIESCR